MKNILILAVLLVSPSAFAADAKKLPCSYDNMFACSKKNETPPNGTMLCALVYGNGSEDYKKCILGNAEAAESHMTARDLESRPDEDPINE